MRFNKNNKVRLHTLQEYQKKKDVLIQLVQIAAGHEIHCLYDFSYLKIVSYGLK